MSDIRYVMTDKERILSVEQRASMNERNISDMRTDIRSTRDEIKEVGNTMVTLADRLTTKIDEHASEMRDKINGIELRNSRDKGFLGGVIASCSVISACIGFALDYLRRG